jgi:hypothetical protein
MQHLRNWSAHAPRSTAINSTRAKIPNAFSERRVSDEGQVMGNRRSHISPGRDVPSTAGARQLGLENLPASPARPDFYKEPTAPESAATV